METVIESAKSEAQERETVLLVDDDEMVMEITRALLTRLGYRVLWAGTGEASIKIAADSSKAFDLVLLDVQLPDMDGSEIYRKLVAIRPGLKVIVCSGYSLDGPARDIIDAGAQEFLQKPITVETLAMTIRKVLGHA